MQILFSNKEEWQRIILICFGDVRYKGSVENINKLISKIAIANYTEKSGGLEPLRVCPSFSKGSCIYIGGNRCPFHQNLECYPVCPHQAMTFFDDGGEFKWLKT